MYIILLKFTKVILMHRLAANLIAHLKYFYFSLLGRVLKIIYLYLRQSLNYYQLESDTKSILTPKTK